MKISVVGAGNVGGMTAMLLAKENLGKIVLIDTIRNKALAKSLDLEDACCCFKVNYSIEGTDDMERIADSDIIVICAGFTRRPGESRKDLLQRNSGIIKDICLNIRRISPQSIIIVVTNPLDLMTYMALKITKFKPERVFGVGVSLDAARFTNLISKELKISNTEIDACVIGTHGEGMLPLPRFTHIRGITLDELLDDKRIEELVKKTIGRGTEIVSLLGNGSSCFGPSAAITQIVKAIIKDEKRIFGVCAYLRGEYGLKDICIGVPCRLGRGGIEEIIELDLIEEERKALLKSAENLKRQFNNLTI
jgi:malate dehydrogenase